MFVDCMHRVPSIDVVISHTNILPNVIQSHWMSECEMRQAQGPQNAMQFKCVQMSLDDSPTSQQTLVQWHQCQCCIVCPCVHAEQPGDWVAADSLSCASMFSGDAVMRSCVRQKSWGGPIHCWSPNPKVGGTCLPGPCGCCAYALERERRVPLPRLPVPFTGCGWRRLLSCCIKRQ